MLLASHASIDAHTEQQALLCAHLHISLVAESFPLSVNLSPTCRVWLGCSHRGKCVASAGETKGEKFCTRVRCTDRGGVKEHSPLSHVKEHSPLSHVKEHSLLSHVMEQAPP